MEKKKTPAKMGRPREFREDAALDAAMRVFWEKGYEGASLDDLTEGMRINRSSLYASFGDKKALFEKVLEHYRQGPLAFFNAALQQPKARAVVESLLRESVKLLADPSNPKGCLSLQGGLACSAESEDVKRQMIDWRKGGLSQLHRRLQRAQAEGDLAEGTNPKDLARYVVILMNGLSVQAVNGATVAEMNRAVDLALQTLPL